MKWPDTMLVLYSVLLGVTITLMQVLIYRRHYNDGRPNIVLDSAAMPYRCLRLQLLDYVSRPFDGR